MTDRLGNYDLVRKIAAGGMAEIYLARTWGEAGFFRDVVIKRLFTHLAEQERQLRMFMDEARLLSQLSHPNIPQVYEVAYSAPYWFIAMEYVEGLTVADLWRLGAKAGAVMPINVAIAVTLQACEALHHVHERRDRAGRQLKIVHRDVNPHNVMLTRDGVVKLMDFGVAATSARKDTQAGVVRGTFAYMAPEQVRGKPLDQRADVFALGILLYELTTGTRLYRGSDIQIMTAIVETDAPPPSSRVPGYPADLEEIVRAALARDRAARLPSAAHLAGYLEELAMRKGMLASPRAIAQYFSAVAPAEPIKEEALGIVEPPVDRPGVASSPEIREIWGPRDDSLPEIDERALLDDLQLLSVPMEGYEGDVVDDADQTGIQEFETLDGMIHTVERKDKRPGLVLEDIADDTERPLLLLDEARKKKGPKSDEYMTDLERRLSDDD